MPHQCTSSHMEDSPEPPFHIFVQVLPADRRCFLASPTQSIWPLIWKFFDSHHRFIDVTQPYILSLDIEGVGTVQRAVVRMDKLEPEINLETLGMQSGGLITVTGLNVSTRKTHWPGVVPKSVEKVNQVNEVADCLKSLKKKIPVEQLDEEKPVSNTVEQKYRGPPRGVIKEQRFAWPKTPQEIRMTDGPMKERVRTFHNGMYLCDFKGCYYKGKGWINQMGKHFRLLHHVHGFKCHHEGCGEVMINEVRYYNHIMHKHKGVRVPRVDPWLGPLVRIRRSSSVKASSEHTPPPMTPSAAHLVTPPSEKHCESP